MTLEEIEARTFIGYVSLPIQDAIVIATFRTDIAWLIARVRESDQDYIRLLNAAQEAHKRLGEVLAMQTIAQDKL